MRSSIAALALVGLIAASPLSAQTIEYETVEVNADHFVNGGERNLPSIGVNSPPSAGAAYGPFRLIDEHRAGLYDVTDEASPAQFAALLRDHPGVAVLEMIECPGTEDDLANMRLGRLIRARGIATHVPRGGSVRSGAVELFLAGARRLADPGAEFAVHSWLDEDGHQPADYGPEAPENRRYLDYYRQMGLTEAEARAFYAMTNSVPFEQARWFDAAEMARWVRLDSNPDAVQPNSEASQPFLRGGGAILAALSR